MAKDMNEDYDDLIGGEMKNEDLEKETAESDAPFEKKKSSNMIVYAIMVPFIAVGGYFAAQSYGLIGGSEAPEQAQVLAASSDQGIITEAPSALAAPVVDISADPVMNNAQSDAGIVLPSSGPVSANEVVEPPALDPALSAAPVGALEPSSATTTVTTTQVSTTPVTAAEPIPSTQVVTTTVTPATVPVVAALAAPVTTANSPVLKDQAAVVERLVNMSEKHDVMLADVVTKMDNMQTMLAQIFTTISGKDYSSNNNAGVSTVASNEAATNSEPSKPAKRKQKTKKAKAKKQPRKEVVVVEKSPEAIEVKKTIVKSEDSYSTQVTIPGRAWVVGKDGSYSTVVVGDHLPNAGRVKSIDVDTGEISIENGKTIKMKSSE